MTTRGLARLLFTMLVMLAGLPTGAAAGVNLKLGDILVAEPGTASLSVIDATTGTKTVISQGGLLSPAHKTVGVAFAPDGDVIAVHRTGGLVRIDPATGQQSILSQGGLFRDPWALAVDRNTGYIYVADSGYDNDRPEINEAGKIIRVDPASGAQEIIAWGSPCTVFPANAACQNTTSAGSYLAHPYGIAIDYSTTPATLVVADMSSFNGKGAIIRIQAAPLGAQTLVWGPASASPPPQVAQVSPLGCPMGVAVEPNGNILTTVYTYPVPPTPLFPPPAGTYYGCAPPGIFRVNLTSNAQTVVNANAPDWAPSRAYAVGDVVRDDALGDVHRAVVAGVSQGSVPAWNTTPGGTTADGSVQWENIGLGDNWLIPFGLAVEPAPTASEPSRYNIVLGDEGHSMVFRLDAGGEIISAPIAANISNVTSVDVVAYTPAGGFKVVPPPPDGPPARFDGYPEGTLPTGTTQATLGLTTDEAATCRYSPQAGVAYASMTSTFTTTGSTAHMTVVSGLTSGQSYQFHVRCVDGLGQVNPDDFVIAFSVASASATTSNFGGTESPLSEGGRWDSPGAWADLLVSNGAYAVGLNAQGRLVTPAMGADQYSEITYDRDPGSSSWVGVTTRTQGSNNGSGYLAIAYAGQVRLYRTDDTGSLSFTMLAAANAAIGTVPRRLRLESEGNTHRVYFNGTQLISHTATGTVYSFGQPGIAASVFGGPQVKILSFEGGSLGAVPVDATPPLRSGGSPAGALPAGTTQATLGLTTDEAATCRYSPQAGVAYASMTSTFTTTGSTTHSTTVSGLTGGQSYQFHVRCADAAGNPNPDDFVIAFSVTSSSTTTSNFGGTESPLSEGGRWDSPGAWADLRASNGAYAVGLNAQGRLVTPAMGADQYSEITYDRDPGSSSWVGITTRTQGAGNGSGYLAIAFAGEVRLYRVDDTGSLSFTMLASASAPIGTAPRRLRLQSEGTTHRVYFNGTQRISHTASGTVYSSGQPGIAASVFGGPQVKILSFEGGSLEAVPVDGTPPLRFNGSPAGALPAGTSQATLALTTDEAAICRYSPQAGVAYGSMTSTFMTTGSTTHSTVVSGLTGGQSYQFHVRCADSPGNANPDDFVIAFSVASATSATSSFPGTESPLSEGGRWDSPGAWADLRVSNGAYAVGLNAQGRLVTPAVGAAQYSEITYDGDPGSSSWVGVTTRTQGAGNGSGYLAIAYAGEVRLYRTDDTGSLSFTMLASASAPIGTAPRRLRLESQGNIHRVFLNGTQLISHTATGTIYSFGQPGIAASVFGGPQVRILSFEGGTLPN